MCDPDAPSFFRSCARHSRKARTCYECKEPITVGDKYVYSVGKYDGDLLSFHTCTKCEKLRDGLTTDYGYEYRPGFGELMEELAEMAREEGKQEGDG